MYTAKQALKKSIKCKDRMFKNAIKEINKSIKKKIEEGETKTGISQSYIEPNVDRVKEYYISRGYNVYEDMIRTIVISWEV